MEELHSMASLTVVLGVIWGIFSYVVLRPLNSAIGNLDKAVCELRQDLRTTEQRRHDLELKVAKLDEKTEALHTRVDRMEGRHDVEHR